MHPVDDRRRHGTKELIAITDGYRESDDLARAGDLKRRGLHRTELVRPSSLLHDAPPSLRGRPRSSAADAEPRQATRGSPEQGRVLQDLWMRLETRKRRETAGSSFPGSHYGPPTHRPAWQDVGADAELPIFPAEAFSKHVRTTNPIEMHVRARWPSHPVVAQGCCPKTAWPWSLARAPASNGGSPRISAAGHSRRQIRSRTPGSAAARPAHTQRLTMAPHAARPLLCRGGLIMACPGLVQRLTRGLIDGPTRCTSTASGWPLMFAQAGLWGRRSHPSELCGRMVL